MASATTAAIRNLVPPRIFADRIISSRHSAAVAPTFSISHPSLPLLLHASSAVRHPKGRESLNTVLYCRKISPTVVAMATGDAPAEVSAELPEFVKTLQEAWDKLDDKYAVTSLAVASLIALYGSVGLISAIDRLPLFPGLFELIGIGYTGWFVYRNLVFKPDREVLLAKLKDIYGEVLGSS